MNTNIMKTSITITVGKHKQPETQSCKCTRTHARKQIRTHKGTHTHTLPPTHLPNVSAGSWLKCQAMCMAASRPHLSPYFTAAPGGDKEHRGACLPWRSVQPVLPAPPRPTRLSNQFRTVQFHFELMMFELPKFEGF